MKNLPLMKIEEQGCIQVNNAFLVQKYPKLVAIEIDLHSKHVEVSGYMSDDKRTNCIALSSHEETIHLHPDKPKEDSTIISFPRFNGWKIFCTDSFRYTLRVCLIKED